jgi:hypothetical protein
MNSALWEGLEKLKLGSDTEWRDAVHAIRRKFTASTWWLAREIRLRQQQQQQQLQEQPQPLLRKL